MIVNNRYEFGVLLKSLNLNGNGLEIGVNDGGYSVYILTFGLKKVYLLDAWKEFPKTDYIDIANVEQIIQDKRYQHVLKIMQPYGDKVEVIRGDSREEFKRFIDGFFDFIYIDANHEYKYIKQDLINWYPKVKVGGVIAGHDYRNGGHGGRGGTLFGVKAAVHEFCRENSLQHVVVPRSKRCPKSWYIVKTERSKT